MAKGKLAKRKRSPERGVTPLRLNPPSQAVSSGAMNAITLTHGFVKGSRRRTASALYVGCAGWTVPPTAKDHFPPEGSHLSRCAARFGAVEINSSFYGTREFGIQDCNGYTLAFAQRI